MATGPTGPKDARLRRAQALAHVSGIAPAIARTLIDRKLAEQERIVRGLFNDHASAGTIASTRAQLRLVESIDRMRVLESQAAATYWSRSYLATYRVAAPLSQSAKRDAQLPLRRSGI
jgi:CRISPR/Cas system-associated endonuclease Cas1